MNDLELELYDGTEMNGLCSPPNEGTRPRLYGIPRRETTAAASKAMSIGWKILLDMPEYYVPTASTRQQTPTHRNQN